MNCPICKTELQPTDAFCPNPKCGYEIHIYPSESKAMAEYEEKRAKNFRNTCWKALKESQAEAQNLVVQSKEIQQKLDEKQKELDDKTKNLVNLLSEARHEIAQLETQLKEKQESASKFQKSIEKFQEQISTFLKQESQYKSEIEEWEKKYGSLFAQMNLAQLEISQLKSQLQSMTKEKERLENTLKKQNNKPASSNPSDSASSSNQNRGESKGEVVFSDGQHTVKQDVYSGNNVFKTPRSLNTNLSGDLFGIKAANAWFLFDLCGKIRDDRYRGIKNEGKQIFDKEIFYIDSITIQVFIYKNK